MKTAHSVAAHAMQSGCADTALRSDDICLHNSMYCCCIPLGDISRQACTPGQNEDLDNHHHDQPCKNDSSKKVP